MLTIQDVGTEILNNKPGKFYIFGGSEYGIKCKYLSILKDHYGSMNEYQSVKDLINIMSTNHIIPLDPTLYVVRYDEEFVSEISEEYAKRIESANIIGTIVCIYEADKHITKLAKYLPNHTVKIDAVNTVYKEKYLKSDFPNMSEKFIQLSAKYGLDYADAKNMCESMSKVPQEDLFALTDSQILSLFGKTKLCTDDDIKVAIAAKNYKYLVHAIEIYNDDLEKIMYDILSTMLEMEKLVTNSRTQSDFQKYKDSWMEYDIRNMFINTYEEIKKLRTYASDVKSSLLYLFGILNYRSIPTFEYMESDT